MTTLLKRALIISTLLFAPALVLAQYDGQGELPKPVRPAATTTPRAPLPPLGPAIKNTIQTAREGVQNIASTTRDAVKARVSDVQSLINERKDAMRERMRDNRQKIAERAEAAKTEARERFGQGAETSVSNIIERLEGAVERQGDIAARLGARIAEYEEQGKTMTASKAILAEAETAITAAHDKIAAVGAALAAALASGNPKAEMPKVREAVAAAQTALKSAHDALRKAIQGVRAESAASTTPTV